GRDRGLALLEQSQRPGDDRARRRPTRSAPRVRGRSPHGARCLPPPLRLRARTGARWPGRDERGGADMNSKTLWAFAITSVAVFMTTLDNLVVTSAIPVIRRDLHAGLNGLEWTVNAYTLTFAVFLLTGAALGDRFGRRRMFTIGIAVFTVASAAAALAPSIAALDIARAVQGLGGALVTPLTLTILSAAVPANKRGLALGVWGGISGLA